ncbi:NCS2 family permease [Salicibibacter cibarius]|uniref:NCS2 family permease n=1 Tax=Salicibibacter cibarius TaxID=2743000 RepID=A0A7T6Z5E7_9BACI|nr:NCS2 family permease [Salicibibacter cibarius]QQK77215.1 NCS2 family permease [Salicibibacter cibarius]
MKQQTTFHYPWYKKEDTDAFFALFQNNLANFVIITIAMLGMGFTTDIVFGRVIPGVAVAVLFGHLYYAYTATRLAKREQRTDVTALSYGISTPVMFIFLFGVLLPAITLTDDPELAWRIGVAAAFISGLIEALVSLVGRWIQRNLPRAAMLGAISGVALTFIAGEMLFMTMEIPVAGLIALAIIIVGVIGKVTMPFRIPASLFAIIIGTILAYAFGPANIGQITDGLAYVGFYPFLPTLAAFEGMTYLFGAMIGIFAVVLPITIYNAIETMNNVEAMEAAGDKYDVRECQAVDGAGAMLGAVFGGAFPTTVLLATVGAKHMGAGRGYSILNAIVYTLTAMFGLIAAVSEIIPVAVIAPVLVYVGASMVSTAFESSASKYYPAVVIAMLPYFSNYLMTRFDDDAPEIVADISTGIVPLGDGAMFTALIFGAITVFIIDGDFKRATVFACTGSVFSFFGLMHAPELAFNASPDFAIGYLIVGLFFFYQAIKDVKVGKIQELDQ